MEKHIKVARAHRFLSWAYAFAFIVMTFFASAELRSKGSISVDMYPLLAVFAGLFALHHFIAKGAKEKKPWARIASIVVACLVLPGFPLFTLIGGYLLINIWTAELAQPVNPSAQP